MPLFRQGPSGRHERGTPQVDYVVGSAWELVRFRAFHADSTGVEATPVPGGLEVPVKWNRRREDGGGGCPLGRKGRRPPVRDGRTAAGMLEAEKQFGR